MKGYKALDEHMCAVNGNKMQYELNKEYVLDGDLEINKNGYHFCKDLIWVLFTYNNINNNRFFEIDTLDGEVQSLSGTLGSYDLCNIDRNCSNKIKLVREIYRKELNDYITANIDGIIESDNDFIKYVLISNQYHLDQFIKDPDPRIRMAVANQGYGLDKLINDPDPRIREYAKYKMKLKLNMVRGFSDDSNIDYTIIV